MTRDKHSLQNAAARKFETARQVLTSYKVQALGAGILLLMTLNLVAVTARKSITNDEVVLIPAAYYHLVTNDLELIREHPPLCKLLAGVPLLFFQPNELSPTEIPSSIKRPQREWAYFMRFWQDNSASFETISFWARMPMIGLTLALGVLIFCFTRDLFGPRAALLALAMFALEPTVLAHARVVQTDIPAAFGFLLSAYALHHYLRRPNWKLAASVGLAAGVAILAKYSMVILGPILFLVFLALLWRQPRQRAVITAHALIATVALLLIINAGYFFHNRPLSDEDSQWLSATFPSTGTAVLASIRTLKLVLPTDFLIGVYWQLRHGRDGHPASLLGMYSDHGWWFYFPVAFALKTTIPFLLLSLSSLGWALYHLVNKREGRLLILVVPFALYTAFMMFSPINIGIRYYLPAYSFLFILSAGMLEALLRKRKSAHIRIAGISVVAITFSWMSLETLRAYPNYIPYMNQLAYSRPHWWYLSDSNVEWGDDIKELAGYLRIRGETRVRAMLLGGFVMLGFYEVDYEDASTSAKESAPRYTALGASFLNGSTVPFYDVNGQRVSHETRVNTFDAFRHQKPEAVIGNSIYVYRMRD